MKDLDLTNWDVLSALLDAALAGGRPQAFVEARYHYLVAAPSPLTWLIPFTVGIRF